MPNHYVGDLLPTIGISGLSRVRTELMRLAVIAALAPHPVQMHRQLPGHRYLGDLSPSPHGKVEERIAPLGLAPYRDLRRFHQQKAQQHVALLADVSQATPIATGLFRRNQTHIAGDLFAAVKAFREFQSLTRRLRPSADRLRDASSTAASPDASPLLLPAHASVPGSSASVGRVSRASLAVDAWPTEPMRSTPVPCGRRLATTPSCVADLR